MPQNICSKFKVHIEKKHAHVVLHIRLCYYSPPYSLVFTYCLYLFPTISSALFISDSALQML